MRTQALPHRASRFLAVLASLLLTVSLPAAARADATADPGATPSASPSPSHAPTTLGAPPNVATHDQAEPTLDLSFAQAPSYDAAKRTLTAFVVARNSGDFPVSSVRLTPGIAQQTFVSQQLTLPTGSQSDPAATTTTTRTMVRDVDRLIGSSLSLGSVPAHGSASATVSLALPAGLPTGTYSLTVRAVDRFDQQLGEDSISLAEQISGTGSYLAIDGDPSLVDAAGQPVTAAVSAGSLPTVHASLTNASGAPITATPTLTVTAALDSTAPLYHGQASPVTVPAGGTATLAVPVRGATQPGLYTAEVSLAGSDGAPVGVGVRLPFAVSGTSAGIMNQQPQAVAHFLSPSTVTDTVVLSPALDGATAFTGTLVTTLYRGNSAIKTASSSVSVSPQFPTTQSVKLRYLGWSGGDLRLVSQLKGDDGTVLDTFSTAFSPGSPRLGVVEWALIAAIALLALVGAIIAWRRRPPQTRYREPVVGLVIVFLAGALAGPLPRAHADEYYDRHINHLSYGDLSGDNCCRNALTTAMGNTGVKVNSRIVGGSPVSGDPTSVSVQSGQDAVILYSYTVEPAWGVKDGTGTSFLSYNTPLTFFQSDPTSKVGYATFPLYNDDLGNPRDPFNSVQVRGDLMPCANNLAFNSSSIGGARFWKNIQPSYTDPSTNNAATATDSTNPTYYVNAQFDRHGGYVVQVAACAARPTELSKTASKVIIGFTTHTVAYWYGDSNTTDHSSSFNNYSQRVVSPALWTASSINYGSLACRPYLVSSYSGYGDSGWTQAVPVYVTIFGRRRQVGVNYVPTAACQPHTWPWFTLMRQASDPNNQGASTDAGIFFGIPMPPPDDHYPTLFVPVLRNGSWTGTWQSVGGPAAPIDGDQKNSHWYYWYGGQAPVCEVYSVYPSSTASSAYTNDNQGRPELPDSHAPTPFTTITQPKSVAGSATAQDALDNYQNSCSDPVTYPTQTSQLGATLTGDSPSAPTLTRVLTATASTASGPTVDAGAISYNFSCGMSGATGTMLPAVPGSYQRQYRCVYPSAGTVTASVTVSAAGAQPATATARLTVVAPGGTTIPSNPIGRFCTGS